MRDYKFQAARSQVNGARIVLAYIETLAETDENVLARIYARSALLEARARYQELAQKEDGPGYVVSYGALSREFAGLLDAKKFYGEKCTEPDCVAVSLSGPNGPMAEHRVVGGP